jgi:hypothetical protein
MANTTNLSITLLEQSQAQKEITANAAFVRIDALLNRGAIDKDLSTPPASPNAGDCYIIAASPTGSWASKAGQIAYYEQIWRFVVPNEGMSLWVNDENLRYTFDGASWIRENAQQQNISLLGINATADAANKLAVASDNILFTHDGDDMRLKLNKLATVNTTSLVFQTNNSGRAEFGLAGNDDFAVKVSPDGTTWHDAILVDKDNGAMSLSKPLGLAIYAVAGVPAASSYAGHMIYVSNGAAGNSVVAFSNGTNWLRCDNLAAISAS